MFYKFIVEALLGPKNRTIILPHGVCRYPGGGELDLGGFPRSMALVAPPWRDPPPAIQLPLGGPHTDETAPGPLRELTTPGTNSSQSGGSSQSNDKNQNIECVVCGDKSSGKHYGQFTCEGNLFFFYILFSNIGLHFEISVLRVHSIFQSYLDSNLT